MTRALFTLFSALLFLSLVTCAAADSSFDDPPKEPSPMALQKNVNYRFTVKFEPPLTTLDQFREFAMNTTNDRSAVVGVTPGSAVVVCSFLIDIVSKIRPGKVWFKVGGRTPNGMPDPSRPISDVRIENIVVEKKFR